MHNQKKAYLYALSAIVCWSTVASAFKIALREMDFLHLLLISSGTAALFFGILLATSSQLRKSFLSSQKEYFRSAILGLINPFLYYIVLLKAYSIIPAQFAMSLNYIWPITLVLLSIPLLKQKIGWRSILCIFISFSGVVVIANKGSFVSLETPDTLGVILALISSLFWALFWIFNVRDQRKEKQKLFLNFVFGFIYILLAIILFSELEFPDYEGVLAGIYIGLAECGVSYLFWLKALQMTSSTDKISNLVYLSPFFSLILIHVIIGESIYLSTVAGLILIITGIILQNFAKKTQHS